MGLPHEEMQQGGTSGHVVEGDSGVLVTIFKHAVYMKFLSEEAGTAVYRECDYISIRTHGQKHSNPVRKIKDQDKVRFPKIWEAYQKNESVVEDGTPIDRLPTIDKARLYELKAAGIKTIEMLASIQDGNVKSLGPGGMTLKTKAKQYLEGNSGNSVKLEEAMDRIAKLTAMVEKLTEAQANPAPKKRGRPKKNVSADDSTGCAE